MHLKGTSPYTSGEILSGRRYFHGHHDVFYNAVHDLESFFWVLVHICLTRQGPGGVRREELKQKNQVTEKYHGLRRVILPLFDSDMSIIKQKSSPIHMNLDNMFWTISINISPAQRPRQGMVSPGNTCAPVP